MISGLLTAVAITASAGSVAPAQLCFHAFFCITNYMIAHHPSIPRALARPHVNTCQVSPLSAAAAPSLASPSPSSCPRAPSSSGQARWWAALIQQERTDSVFSKPISQLLLQEGRELVQTLRRSGRSLHWQLFRPRLSSVRRPQPEFGVPIAL